MFGIFIKASAPSPKSQEGAHHVDFDRSLSLDTKSTLSLGFHSLSCFIDGEKRTEEVETQLDILAGEQSHRFPCA